MFLWFLCPHPSGEDCWILCQLSPPSFLPSFPRCQPSTTSRRVHCSLPDLHCKDRDHLRSVFPAGPPPRSSAASVPCRTATATLMRPVLTCCAQCSLPDLNRDHLRSVFPAGPPPRDRMSERMSEDMSERMSEDMSERMSDKMLGRINQKECHKICQT